MNIEPVPSSYYRRPVGTSAAVSSFMWATYAWMAAGLAVTAAAAWAVVNTPAVAQVVLGNRLAFYGIMFAQLAVVFTFSRKVASMSAQAAGAVFLGYALLNGLTLSTIFIVYAHATIASAFMVSAVSFGALAAFGAVTKRDLSPMSQFLFMGVVGILIASIVNIFLHSAAMNFIISCAGVLTFAGLTAYDNQKLKHMYLATGGVGNLAIHGALMLYLDFINMFLFILRLFDNRR